MPVVERVRPYLDSCDDMISPALIRSDDTNPATVWNAVEGRSAIPRERASDFNRRPGFQENYTIAPAIITCRPCRKRRRHCEEYGMSPVTTAPAAELVCIAGVELEILR